jgi:hypothetical protein
MEPWQFILIFILPGIGLFAVAVCVCLRPPEWDDEDQ